MRPERLYLQDILDAADNISFHIAGRSAEHFLPRYRLSLSPNVEILRL